jgi:flagellar basal body-associated protein FliL
MEANSALEAKRARRVWIALVALVVLVAALAVWMSARMSGKMSAAGASDEQAFAKATAGSTGKVVLEVAEIAPSGTFRGKLLVKKTEEVYVQTGTLVAVQFSAQTKMVMGRPEDIRPGAIVHVTGTVRKDRGLDAGQIVILTGYVHVE